jgi:hypothetical protein
LGSVLLFKRNLERTFPERERLVAEVARTVLFEISRVVGLPTLGLVH